MKRFLSIMRNSLAAAGLLSLMALAYVYYQGRSGLEQADPAAVEVMSLLAQRTMQTDMASATVQRIYLHEGISLKTAITAMKERAKALDVRLVDSHRMRSAADADGELLYTHVEIFEFCDRALGSALLEYNPDFAAYMPCRVALVQDRDGRAWFVTLDLGLLIYGGREMDAAAKQFALQIKENLLDIMTAGATGSR